LGQKCIFFLFWPLADKLCIVMTVKGTDSIDYCCHAVLLFMQNDQMGVPLIFKVDPDGFYLSARGEKHKVCKYDGLA